jgi:hypothetical protein
MTWGVNVASHQLRVHQHSPACVTVHVITVGMRSTRYRRQLDLAGGRRTVYVIFVNRLGRRYHTNRPSCLQLEVLKGT